MSEEDTVEPEFTEMPEGFWEKFAEHLQGCAPILWGDNFWEYLPDAKLKRTKKKDE